jgi:hypothetical protein
VPIFVDLSVIGVALGALLMLRLVGGSMPWGQLLIAVGPDGRPMRPRVKWQLWSISQGEPPRRALMAGLASCSLGLAAILAAQPWVVRALFHPIPSPLLLALALILAFAVVLVPIGTIVLLRALLDLGARRSSMAGRVVGMRRDLGLFGHSYHVAVQAGDRALAKGIWAESFKIDRESFKLLKPGDRLTIEYSPRLRFVYRLELPTSPQGESRFRA